MGEHNLKVNVDDGSFDAYVALPAAGRGPAIILLHEIFGVNESMRRTADLFAEEGYVVVVPDLFWRFQPHIELGYSADDFQMAFDYYQRFDVERAMADIQATITAARKRSEVVGRVGALGYCLGGKLAYLAAARCGVDCAVSYYGVGIEQSLDEASKVSCPIAFHFGADDNHVTADHVRAIQEAFGNRSNAEFYIYPGCGHAFASPERESYSKVAASMAHSRTLALFRRTMGPHYDLSTLWDKHTEYEFATRDVEATMATMVAEPYVNHVPTMTGGVGQSDLARFYRDHFIPKTPKDTKLIPVSRTVGADRIVDEMVFCFTHDIEIDWMLPGVAPTGRYVEIPLVAIVCFRGDKLYHEHIYWDQASVLVQIGKISADGLPVAGIDTAKKLVDERLPSNVLMTNWSTSGRSN